MAVTSFSSCLVTMHWQTRRFLPWNCCEMKAKNQVVVTVFVSPAKGEQDRCIFPVLSSAIAMPVFPSAAAVASV